MPMTANQMALEKLRSSSKKTSAQEAEPLTHNQRVLQEMNSRFKKTQKMLPTNPPISTAPGAELPRQIPNAGMRSGWLIDLIAQSRNLSDALGLTAEIERRTAVGQTAAVITEALGSRLERVATLARANGEQPNYECRAFVRNVRISLGIPPQEDRDEFSAWLSAYLARQQSPRA